MDMVMEKDMDIGYWYKKNPIFGITSNFALYRPILKIPTGSVCYCTYIMDIGLRAHPRRK
jgi:hypothetical protein